MTTTRLTPQELSALRALAAKDILTSSELLRLAGWVTKLIDEIERLRRESWLGEDAA